MMRSFHVSRACLAAIALASTAAFALHNENSGPWPQGMSAPVLLDTTIRISNDPLASKTPEIFVSGGDVHIFWTDDLAPYGSIKYSRSVDGGASFSPQTTLITPTVSGHWVTPESFAFGAAGSAVYITASEIITDSAGHTRNYLSLMCSRTRGASWDSLTRCAESESFGLNEPWGLATHGTSLSQIVSNWFPADTNSWYRLIASTDNGTTWNTPETIKPSNGNIRVAVNSFGSHVVCDDPFDEILYLHNTEGGANWTDTVLLSTPDFISDEPVLAVNESGLICVAWRDDKLGGTCEYFAHVLFRRSTDNGMTWGPEQIVTDTPTGDHPVIALDGDFVAVAWNNCNDPYPLSSLMKISLDGGLSWSETIHLNQHGEDIQIALADSSVHATWFDRVTSYPAEIYYRRQKIGGVSSVQFDVAQNWNLVSVPVRVSDYRRTAVYPSAISDAFAFESSVGYVKRDTLTNGPGYWLKFATSQTVTIPGWLRNVDTIDVNTGWNIIGSISSPVNVDSIVVTPPGVVISDFFGHDGTYTPADTLYPGKGYWVKASGAGSLMLSSGTALQGRTGADAIKQERK